MSGTDNNEQQAPTGGSPAEREFIERRQGGSGTAARRAAVSRAIGRPRLEDFHATLSGLAVAVFGQQATVVPHLRTRSGREWVTFVVDAADPSSIVQYEEFLPRERAFWTAYAQVIKPPSTQFIVAVRPARGWCRVEALAPFFTAFQPPDTVA